MVAHFPTEASAAAFSLAATAAGQYVEMMPAIASEETDAIMRAAAEAREELVQIWGIEPNRAETPIDAASTYKLAEGTEEES